MSVDAATRTLLEPVTIGGLSLRNRIVMAPMSRYFCPDAIPHQGVVDYYARRAAAGVGLILSEATYIDHPSAESYTGVPRFHGAALDGWRKVATAVHAAGGRMFPQLWHVGSFRQTGMAPDPMVPGFGPSENLNAFTKVKTPTHAMTETEIADVIAAYGRAGAAAKETGFDGVEVHGAHGYLIDEFLWGQTNRRTDGWGGGHVGRTRFAAEVIAAIRVAVGPDFPISFRWSQFKQQDYTARLAETPAELEQVLRPLVDAGLTMLHCSARRYWEPGFADHGDMTLAGWTKKVSGLPAIAVGGAGLDRPGLVTAHAASVEAAAGPLARGEFDLLAVGRALLADPDWVTKLRDGRTAEGLGYDKAALETLV